MPFYRASAPGDGPPSFDGRIVCRQSEGEASQRVQRTGGRTLQPGIELRRLPLAHQRGEVLRQVDGLGDLGMLRLELGEMLRLGLPSLRGTPPHQPGPPTGRQRGAHGFGHAWEGPPRAALARGEPLGLAYAARRGRDEGIAAGVATLLQGATQAYGGLAAGIPAFEELRFIGVAHTVPAVTALFARGKRGPLEVALHRRQAHPEVLGHRWGRPALVVQGPDLCMHRLPSGLALGCALLGRP